MIEKVTYNGRIYSRDTEAKDYSHRNYFRGNQRSKEGEILLHRQIYVDNFGPIPFMHLIHHKDRNPNNNAPENLEAINERDHLHKYHRFENRKMPVVS